MNFTANCWAEELDNMLHLHQPQLTSLDILDIWLQLCKCGIEQTFFFKAPEKEKEMAECSGLRSNISLFPAS